jgi:hypothetical protein
MHSDDESNSDQASARPSNDKHFVSLLKSESSDDKNDNQASIQPNFVFDFTPTKSKRLAATPKLGTCVPLKPIFEPFSFQTLFNEISIFGLLQSK